MAFSLAPAALLFLAAEGFVRFTGLDRPLLQTAPLPEEEAGLFRPDRDLFWSLRPGLDQDWGRTRVKTNSLGLRSPEVGEKQSGEFRILSLGESSTFGVGVDPAETYAAQLESLLEAKWRIPVSVINAGVPAYSSFQSLNYLELRGFKLDPDGILFYHELNDYLPSSLRDSSHNEIGVLKTDRQLYDSRAQGVHRLLTDRSALYRCLSHQYALRRIRAFNREAFENPLHTIGLPDLSLPPRLAGRQAQTLRDVRLNERSLGRRVSDEERLANLEALHNLCRRENIPLVIAHPSYRESERHHCLLTRFCEEQGVPMFEAFHALHPREREAGALFYDSWHPNAEGHRRLAEGFARALPSPGAKNAEEILAR